VLPFSPCHRGAKMSSFRFKDKKEDPPLPIPLPPPSPPSAPKPPRPARILNGITDGCLIGAILIFFCVFPPVSILLIALWLVDEIRTRPRQ